MKKNFGILVLSIVTLLWSNGFLATQHAIVANLSVEAILTIRFLIAATILGIANNKKIFKIKKPTLRRGIIAGVIVFVAFFTQTWGQNTTPISLVALIGSGYVVTVPFFMWAARKKRPSNKVFLLTFAAMVGLMILNYSGGSISFKPGAILVFISAVAFGVHVGFTGAYCDDDATLDIVFVQIATAGILSLIAMIIGGKFPSLEEVKNGAYGVLYLAIFSTAICYYLQILGQKYVKAENASIILSLEGVFAAVLSIVLGYEAFKWNILIGGFIIVMCAILINLNDY